MNNEQSARQPEHHQQGNRMVQTYAGSVVSLNASDKSLPFHQRNACLRISFGILKEMTDFKLLLQSPGFLLITLSNFFIFLGYFTPFIYVTKVAKENGIESGKASFLLAIIGITNIPFRMLFGLIADRKLVSAINLNTISVAIATAPLFLYSVLQKEYWSQIVFVIVFAIGMGKTE
jgi:predicted MFS family arabinose efflux permease